MKKNTLTSAVVAGIAGAAGLAGVASAVNVNPDGLGQVLIYPYYTVNANQLTIFSVINTTAAGKAVKVRLLEGRNSQEVLDFNLYLSPFDVWTAGLSAVDPANVNSGGQLTSFDTSCTVPGIETQADDTQEFSNVQYAQLTPDGGPRAINRTREGYIEVIEMGELADLGAGRNYLTAATHVAGRPASCATLVASHNNPSAGFWGNLTNGLHDGVTQPTGGLFGSAEIVNSDLGTNITYNAVAVDGFFIAPQPIAAATDDLHFDPGNVRPNLNQTSTSPGVSTAFLFQGGALISADFPSGAPDAVSAVLMNNAIFGEYSTEASLNAASEWVITFPTKALHIVRTFNNTPAGRLPFTSPNAALDSGDDVFAAFDGAGEATPVGACEPISVNQVDASGNAIVGANGAAISSIFDREEGVAGTSVAGVQFSPAVPTVTPGLNLCFEAQVVSFNQATTGDTLTAGNTASAVLGSRFARNLNLCRVFNVDGTCSATGAFDAGWLRMNLGNNNNFMLSNLDGATNTRNQIFGLPVTGFWASNYRVSNDASILAYYSGTHQHRGSRRARSIAIAGDAAGATINTTTTTGLGSGTAGGSLLGVFTAS